jgi:arsenite/tail-anchored protein-transporting ATPase
VTKLPAFLTDEALRLLLFGGKGGVGKTTCAAAAALHLARQAPEETFLLVSTDPAHSLRDRLGKLAVPENLSVLEYDPTKALADFLREHHPHFRELVRRGTFLDDEDVERLVRLSPPGASEFLAALELSRWAARGYSRLLVDTAPTGHTLRLLETPALLEGWLLAADALLAKHRYTRRALSGRDRPDDLDAFLGDWGGSVEALRALLTDGRSCRFVPVMTADRLTVQETERLLTELDARGICASEVVVNRLQPPEDCAFCREERRRELEELRTLPPRFEGRTLWSLPLLPLEGEESRHLRTFWSLSRELSSAERRDPELPASPGDLPAVRVDHPAPRPPPGTALLLLAGKGGVGKTTLACAAALRLAADGPERNVLLFSSDPAHSLSDSLEQPIGPKPVRLSDNLSALEVDAGAEFVGVKDQYRQDLEGVLQKLSPKFDVPFDRVAMEKLLELSPPGVDEIMSLATLSEFLEAGTFDLVVLDTAPTGHLVRLLETPEIAEQWLRAFLDLLLKHAGTVSAPKLVQRLARLARNVRRLRKLLRDPARASLYGVSIPTEMAFEETKDLFEACSRFGIAAPVLFLNMLTPASECPTCSPQREAEQQLRGRFALAFPERHRVLLSRGAEPRGIERLQALGAELFGH